jgi:hypothetical protein
VGALLLDAAEQRPPWVSGIVWPKPRVVDPGPPGGVPSDAIVLFDGKDLSAWTGADQWEVKDGYAICRGDAQTKQAFGDCQLHIEWAAPTEITGAGQARGNSGVFFMGFYELQILDSFASETYIDGQAGAVYKQHPPLVNACRKPGEWQTYDVIFNAPRFDKEGNLAKPAYITALHNGVVIQNHFELLGKSNYRIPPHWAAHPDKLPLRIQYHFCPVKFRNIWIREIQDHREDLLAPLRAKLKQEALSSNTAATKPA